MIWKAAVDHPYHVLFIILALVNADRDDQLSTSTTANRRGASRLSRTSSNVGSNSKPDDEVRIMVFILESVFCFWKVLCHNRANWSQGRSVGNFKDANKALNIKG